MEQDKMVRAGRPAAARLHGTPNTGPALSPREQVESAADDASIGTDSQGRMLRRRRRVENKFHFPPEKIPPGWSYEWKRQSCYGQPDTDHQVNLRENCWTPVPAERHPEMMPVDHKGPITKDGMILMERPEYLTKEARQEDYDFAMGEVRKKESQMGQTPPGTFPRNHPSAQRVSGVRKSFGPINAEEM
jgi:hypothetical protein